MWTRLWYESHPLALVLWPVSFIYCSLVRLRRLMYRSGLLPTHNLPVPVIVVGNITVGGTGKTPMITWLADWLREAGYRPGLVARGYKGKARNWPQQVRADSDPNAVGDEPILLVRRTGCPMAVGPDRVAAARALLEHTDCDVLISDDGLQHYALGRAVEIAVVDGDRRYGNGFCLPAGPLREPRSRLDEVDLIVCNGAPGRGEFAMQYRLGEAVNVHDPSRKIPLDRFHNADVHALAGIGFPQRFFRALQVRGIEPRKTREFPDHHAFTEADLDFAPADHPILMTEKDAIKCQRLQRDNLWYVLVNVEMDPRFGQRLGQLVSNFGSA